METRPTPLFAFVSFARMRLKFRIRVASVGRVRLVPVRVPQTLEAVLQVFMSMRTAFAVLLFQFLLLPTRGFALRTRNRERTL